MDWLRTWIITAAAATGTAATYLWGGWDAILTALVALVALDYLTGVMAAYVERRLDSGIGLRGIVKKVAVLMVVAVAHIIDQAGGFAEPLLRTIAIWALIANEGISVLENLATIGVPVPEALRQALLRMQERGSVDG